ncbi:hypothetical protein [Haloarcula japonica]|uniref:hypothetical protein n=1 Tax=Haloarcula japonica TaxID=29282 RepID=UPI000B1F6E6B|nr:hypothetical protein [Haloarcula japonica]
MRSGKPSERSKREINDNKNIPNVAVFFPLVFILTYGIFTIITGLEMWIGAIVVLFSAIALHFITYTSFTIPIVLSVIVLSLTAPFFLIFPKAAIVATSGVIAYYIYRFYYTSSPLFVGSAVVYLVGTLLNLVFNSTPLPSPDAAQYYGRVRNFGTISEYLVHLIQLAQEDISLLKSSMQTFPAFYLPLYKSYGFESPAVFVVINMVLWVTTVLLFKELIKYYLTESANVSPGIVSAMLLLSPTAMYWSSTFLKDITSVFLCMLATYLFFRKRAIMFLIVVLVATSIRLYSIAIISIYIATIMWSPLLLGIGLFGSAIFTLIYTGNIVTLFNSILVFGYFFVSPHPVQIENWLTPRLIPRLIEAVLYAGGLFISGRFAVTSRKLRNHYLILTAGILIYSLVIVSVAYRYTVFQRGLPYGFGTAGENILRKMLPILPLIAVWMSITVSNMKYPRLSISSRNQSNESSYRE